MAKKVPFSGEHLSLADAARHHNDTDGALKVFFSAASPSFTSRFAGYKTDELLVELGERLVELDRNTTMSLLAAIEAAFRIDYLQRCYQKKKDNISLAFRSLYKQKEVHASLENDIFEVWKNHINGGPKLIGELRGAFKFRHWMAHGRYWTPKLGKNYDYLTVYLLASQALTSFPLLT